MTFMSYVLSWIYSICMFYFTILHYFLMMTDHDNLQAHLKVHCFDLAEVVTYPIYHGGTMNGGRPHIRSPPAPSFTTSCRDLVVTGRPDAELPNN